LGRCDGKWEKTITNGPSILAEVAASAGDQRESAAKQAMKRRRGKRVRT